ncbi:MAG TPA: hypothetical protein VE130_03180 [Nitrososphaeraceae archaeon]|jgi:hypothetical protein|nr:hypothetical protein [Nitrososphaeraceae archaeon]
MKSGSIAYDSDVRMLKDHGNRYVCVLYFLARGIMGRPFDSDKVYGELQIKGFNDRRQARIELVQFLESERRVQYDEVNNTISLTLPGLEWARLHCEESVYQTYRDLQNTF